jgi:hypothetical protein
MNLSQAKLWEEYVKDTCPIRGGSFFCTVKLVTNPPLLKNIDGKRGKDATLNPYEGRLKKHCVIKGDATFGPTQFRTYVVNKRRKAGFDNPEEVEIRKPSGRHHIDGYNGITQSDTIPERHYASIYFLRKDLRIETWYELDNVRVEIAQDAHWTRYIRKSLWAPRTASTKHGVESPKTVAPMLDSIVTVKCGQFVIGNTENLAAPALVEGGETAPAEVPAEADAEADAES